MAVRKRVLLPDITVQTVSGPMDIVSRQSIMEALADAVVFQEFAGGFVSSAVQREATGAPDEMLTVVAVVEWKDRADAKPQPEGRAREELSELQEEMAAAQPRLTPEEWEQQARHHAENEQAAEVAKARRATDVAADVGDEGVAAAMQVGAENPVEQHPVLPFDHPAAESPDGLDESLLEDEDVETPESVR